MENDKFRCMDALRDAPPFDQAQDKSVLLRTNGLSPRTLGPTNTVHPLAAHLGLSLAVTWNGPRIVGLNLVESSSSDVSATGPLGDWIACWNDHRSSPGLPENILDWTSVPRRTREILATLEQVPAGRTCTYGEVAHWAGIPRGFQAVGQAMARNPFVLVVPCHRVLARDGGLGGYSAGGPLIKRRLLDHEGGVL